MFSQKGKVFVELFVVFLDGAEQSEHFGGFAGDLLAFQRKKNGLEMEKIQALAKRESESGVVILKKLYSQPIISSKNVMEWTGFSRSGAIKAINRFVSLGILVPKTGSEAYDKVYTYKKYIDIFIK